MTQEELNEIIENHQHWLKRDCKGWEFMRANLAYTDLAYTDLAHTNLSYVNLEYANLTHANLAHTNLLYANLSYADLIHANFSYTDLAHTRLAYTNLEYANLSYANLEYADLSYAKLVGVNLANAFNTPFIPMACPTEGSFIGWKKANDGDGKQEVIIKLFIPEDARRSSSTGRKCRCDKARVMSITSLDGRFQHKMAYSGYDSNFVYEVGEEVSVTDFYEDRFEECAAGIHFFINREEAVRY